MMNCSILNDVLGKRNILHGLIATSRFARECYCCSGTMSRFGGDPKWLIYLRPPWLLKPASVKACLNIGRAFSYFRHEGVARSSASRNTWARGPCDRMQRRRIRDQTLRAWLTKVLESATPRTGRRFFNDRKLEAEFLLRVQVALSGAGIWQELKTDWICLDCELMPWSAKAQELCDCNTRPRAPRHGPSA